MYHFVFSAIKEDVIFYFRWERCCLVRRRKSWSLREWNRVSSYFLSIACISTLSLLFDMYRTRSGRKSWMRGEKKKKKRIDRETVTNVKRGEGKRVEFKIRDVLRWWSILSLAFVRYFRFIDLTVPWIGDRYLLSRFPCKGKIFTLLNFRYSIEWCNACFNFTIIL